ncbi:MAG: hypothetical protein K2X43_01600 [Hyphomonadaceae bacterium]|nr:hypothetical protein [Hyphomonadaceae bacterium]
MKKSAAGVCAFALLAMLAGGAAAQETGVAGIHSWVKVGRKTCMLDHYHDGSGSGATRAQAERAAVAAWAEFTAWEYGGPWGRYSNAVSKSTRCSQGSGGWSCAVQARPCRPY